MSSEPFLGSPDCPETVRDNASVNFFRRFPVTEFREIYPNYQISVELFVYVLVER